MKVFNWAKILWTIKYLNNLNEKSYFNLQMFCEENNLDYKRISNFLEISNSIIEGNSELIKVIEKDKKTLDKLNNLDVSRLKNI